MYDELVKSLRICAEGQHCDKCGKWEAKQNGGLNACQELLCTEATDAIEELNTEVDKWKAKYAECFRYSMELFEENQNLQDVFRPLHEMPHGDLIDRDALRDNNCDAFKINGADGTILAMDVSIIDAAPTIIPANTILENEIHIIDTKGKSNYNPKRRFVISAPTIIPADKNINIQKEFLQNWHEEGDE